MIDPDWQDFDINPDEVPDSRAALIAEIEKLKNPFSFELKHSPNLSRAKRVRLAHQRAAFNHGRKYIVDQLKRKGDQAADTATT